MNRTMKSALGIAALTTLIAGATALPATAAPGDPVSVSAESEAYLASIGVSVTYENGGIHLARTSDIATAVILGPGIITTQDRATSISAGSVLPAHGSYPWAQEITELGQDLSGSAHTSWRAGGLSGEDATTITDRMTTVLDNATYAGNGGYGHEVSTLSDCTVNVCGVYIAPVVSEVDANGDDVLRTTADATWVPIITDPSTWEDSTGIVWDDSTGLGLRDDEYGVSVGYRAQSTAPLSSPWLSPARPSIPALDDASVVNPDGTVSVGISDGGVLARIGHIGLNLGYLGGQGEVPEEPTPETPVVVTPVPKPEPLPDPTPETPVVEPEPQTAPEEAPPVLRFETGDFAPRSDVSPASSGLTTAQWMFLGIAGVASLALAGGLLLSARSAETPRTRRTLFVSSPLAGAVGLSMVTLLALQGCSAPQETSPEPVSAPVASQPTSDASEDATQAPEAADDVASESTEPAADDRLVIPSVGLDVPLRVEKIGRSLTIDPPSLTDAWEETTGGSFFPGQDGDGTLLVAMHASNQVEAPGNKVSTADGQIAVRVGDQVQVRDETYVVTKTTTIGKSEWSGLREGWDSVEGRLLLVTCLPPQQVGEFTASENVVIVGERVEV